MRGEACLPLFEWPNQFFCRTFSALSFRWSSASYHPWSYKHRLLFWSWGCHNPQSSPFFFTLGCEVGSGNADLAIPNWRETLSRASREPITETDMQPLSCLQPLCLISFLSSSQSKSWTKELLEIVESKTWKISGRHIPIHIFKAVWPTVSYHKNVHIPLVVCNLTGPSHLMCS